MLLYRCFCVPSCSVLGLVESCQASLQWCSHCWLSITISCLRSLIPTSALIVRADGQHVAVVDQDHIIRFRKVGLGRDYGGEIEIVAGLEGNETIVSNPTDDVREEAKIEPTFPQAACGHTADAAAGFNEARRAV